MRRLIVLVSLAGCARAGVSNATCEWPPETPVALNLQFSAQQRHLSSDAVRAEDLAIRYSDAHAGPHSGVFTGFTDYGRTREQCTSALFAGVAATHSVTAEQVRDALLRRPLAADLTIILSFVVAYILAAGWLAGRVRGNYPLADGRIAALVATAWTSIVAGVLAVLLGEIWSVSAESIRLGTGHLSNRTFRIPWVQHRVGFFVGAICLYWIVAAFQYVVASRGDRAPASRPRFVLLMALITLAAIACTHHPTEAVCAGLEYVSQSTPDSASIPIGESFTATAGAEYGACVGEPGQRPADRFNWKASDATIVAIAPIDSNHARITGLLVGSAIVTPTYQASGDPVPSIRVVVRQ